MGNGLIPVVAVPGLPPVVVVDEQEQAALVHQRLLREGERVAHEPGQSLAQRVVETLHSGLPLPGSDGCRVSIFKAQEPKETPSPNLCIRRR